MTYPTPDPTSTAPDREAAWLAMTGPPGLPSLLKDDGGPWDVVQADWPGARVGTMKAGIYLLLRQVSDDHVAAQRYRDQYEFAARCEWPVKASTAPLAEQEQQAFRKAIGLLLQRIRGPVGDKSHGGRFLSVGEVPGQVTATVSYEDPEITIAAGDGLRATIVYRADDLEMNG